MPGPIMSAAYAMMIEKMSMKQNTPTVIDPITITKNGTYTAPEGTAYSPITVDVKSGDSIVAVPKTFTANGTYSAPDGKAYSPVTVDVPQIETETKSITANGTYTAPDGKAYSSVNVNVAGTGVPDVTEMPDISAFREGDIVHLTADYEEKHHVPLYAWSCVSDGNLDVWSCLFSTQPTVTSISDFFFISKTRIIPLSEADPSVTVTIQGSDVIFQWPDESNTQTYRMYSANNITSEYIPLYRSEALSNIMALIPDDSRKLLDRTYEIMEWDMSNYTLYSIAIEAVYAEQNNVSITDISLDNNDTLTIRYDGGDPHWDPFVGNHTQSDDIYIGISKTYVAGYYKVTDGKWVILGNNDVPYIYVHTGEESSSYVEFSTLRNLNDYPTTFTSGLLIKNPAGYLSGFDYVFFVEHTGWTAFNTGNPSGTGQGYGSDWYKTFTCGFSITREVIGPNTEIGFGLVLPGYVSKAWNFIPCKYEIITDL